jgi:hypothetical protein
MLVAMPHYKESPKDKHTLGSHEEVLKDLSPLYFANRSLAGTSNGVSTSSGYSTNKQVTCD